MLLRILWLYPLLTAKATDQAAVAAAGPIEVGQHRKVDTRQAAASPERGAWFPVLLVTDPRSDRAQLKTGRGAQPQ